MPEDLKILVKLTLQDLRAFSFARGYTLISIFLIIFLYIVLVFSVSIVYGEPLPTYLLIMSVVTLLVVSILPGPVQYFIHRHNYRKSKLLSSLQSYEFLDEGIHMSSPNGVFTLKWADVFKVQELKSCFVIYFSPVKYNLIPRRCIRSQEELTLLRRVFTEHLDRKKLKLKKYPLGKIALDTGDIIIPAPVTNEIKDPDGAPFMEFHYFLTKQEQLKFNFQLFYTSPVGLISSLLALVLIVINLISLFTNGSYNLSLLVFGAVFLIVLPISIYRNIARQHKHDAALKQKYFYQLYEDHFLLHHPSGVNRIQWGDLVKIKQVGAGILLFITTGLAYFIPKRIFAANPAEYDKLKQFIKSKIPSKSR